LISLSSNANQPRRGTPVEATRLLAIYYAKFLACIAEAKAAV
jgi:hypothetical protein